MTEDRSLPGEWCWCPWPPEGQDPHDCDDHAPPRRCQADGAHVHPTDGDDEP